MNVLVSNIKLTVTVNTRRSLLDKERRRLQAGTLTVDSRVIMPSLAAAETAADGVSSGAFATAMALPAGSTVAAPVVASLAFSAPSPPPPSPPPPKSPCIVGHFCEGGVAIPCGLNTYNTLAGQLDQASCTLCPANSKTFASGSASVDSCFCEAQYYDAIVGPGVECAVCPPGSACAAGNATKDRLPLEPGQWRTGANSVVVETCPVEESCLGGEDPASYCKEGSGGPLCMVCDAGFRQTSMDGCVRCKDNSIDTVEIVAASVMAILLLACYCVCRRRRKVEKAAKNKPSDGEPLEDEPPEDGLKVAAKNKQVAAKNKRSYREPPDDALQGLLNKWLVKFKILAGFQQVLLAMSSVYRIEWPSAFKEVLSYLNVFNFDPTSPAPLDCWGTDFLTVFLVRTLVPLAVIAVFALYFRRAIRRDHEEWGYMFFNGGVLLVFFLYAPITQTVFSFLNVRSFADGYGTYLMADYSVDADGDTYQTILPVTYFMIGVWSVGVPLAMGAFLWRARAPLFELRRREKSRGAYDALGSGDEEGGKVAVPGYVWDLTEALRPNTFYFELFGYLQKLVLVGLLIFFEPGTLVQLTVGLIVCMAYFGLCIHLMPYGSVVDNLMAVVTQCSLLACMLSAYSVRYAEHGGTDTPPLVATVLMVAALLPVGLFLLLSVYAIDEDRFNRWSYAMLGRIKRLVKSVQRCVTRLVHSCDKPKPEVTPEVSVKSEPAPAPAEEDVTARSSSIDPEERIGPNEKLQEVTHSVFVYVDAEGDAQNDVRCTRANTRCSVACDPSSV